MGISGCPSFSLSFHFLILHLSSSVPAPFCLRPFSQSPLLLPLPDRWFSGLLLSCHLGPASLFAFVHRLCSPVAFSLGQEGAAGLSPFLGCSALWHAAHSLDCPSEESRIDLGPQKTSSWEPLTSSTLPICPDSNTSLLVLNPSREVKYKGHTCTLALLFRKLQSNLIFLFKNILWPH